MPGSFWAPTMAKKISVERTSKLPPRTSGLPKSAIDLDEAEEEGVGEAGAHERQGDGEEGLPA